MSWINFPQGPFRVVYKHPAGWRAEICLTAVGQFVASLKHEDEPVMEYDSLVLEQAHGHQFEGLTQQALTQFDAWLVQYGPESLDDLPVLLRINRAQARALLAGPILDWQEAAGWEQLSLKAALMRLQSELEKKLGKLD